MQASEYTQLGHDDPDMECPICGDLLDNHADERLFACFFRMEREEPASFRSLPLASPVVDLSTPDE